TRVESAPLASFPAALVHSFFSLPPASPEAAASPWVAKETEYWIGKKGTSRVLIVPSGGTLNWCHLSASFTNEGSNSPPPNLLRSFPEEPLYLDLHWVRDGASRLSMREPRFHEAVLQLAATLHNRPKDELDGAVISIRGQTILLATSLLLGIP